MLYSLDVKFDTLQSGCIIYTLQSGCIIDTLQSGCIIFAL